MLGDGELNAGDGELTAGDEGLCPCYHRRRLCKRVERVKRAYKTANE